MHQMDLNRVQAFQLLLKTSPQANIKLAEVARFVVERHESRHNGRDA